MLFHSGFDAAPLAEHLSRLTPIPIPYKEPIDWAKWGMTAGIVVIVGALLHALAPILLTRWTWAFFSVVLMIVMTSGYMFTRIRNSPWVGQGGAWIAGGFQTQYGQEVQVIAFICEIFSFHLLRPRLLTQL